MHSFYKKDPMYLLVRWQSEKMYQELLLLPQWMQHIALNETEDSPGYTSLLHPGTIFLFRVFRPDRLRLKRAKLQSSNYFQLYTWQLQPDANKKSMACLRFGRPCKEHLPAGLHFFLLRDKAFCAALADLPVISPVYRNAHWMNSYFS